MRSDIAALVEPNVAALDEMLVAIGQWQANPNPDTWERKMLAIRDYLTVAEQWQPQYLASVVANRRRAYRSGG